MEFSKENYGEIARLYREGEATRIEEIAWRFKNSRKDAEFYVAVEEVVGNHYLEEIKKLLDTKTGMYRVDSESIDPRTTEGLAGIVCALRESESEPRDIAAA